MVRILVYERYLRQVGLVAQQVIEFDSGVQPSIPSAKDEYMHRNSISPSAVVKRQALGGCKAVQPPDGV
jgi:hypothetical protein